MTASKSDIDHLLKLEVDSAKLYGTLKTEPMTGDEDICRQALCAYLEGRGVQSHCILNDELDELITAVKADPSVSHQRLVAKGRKPVAGTNASVEFTDEIQARFERIERRRNAYLKAIEDDSLGEQADGEKDALDFYNESCFVIVHRGQEIASRHDRSLGEDGWTVFGATIAAKQGKDIDDMLDDSCLAGPDGKICAAIDGHLTFKNNRVRISPDLEIDGSVDFSTGNINFPGPVRINEGVRDRFEVRSDSGLEIRKLVEAAHLFCEENITLFQGMAGRGDGTVLARGDFEAGYLEGVEASIAGQCRIKSEMTNCRVSIAASIDAPRAAIRGGEIHIARGGAVGTVGSIQGVRTALVLGQLPNIEQKMHRAMKLLPRIDHELDKRENEMDRFKTTIGKPNAEQATEISFMESEIASLREKRDRLETARERLETIISAHSDCRLTVTSTIFAKSEIWLPGYHARFERDVKGELIIDLDETNTPAIIRGEQVTPLQTVATVRPDDRVLARPRPETTDQDQPRQAA